MKKFVTRTVALLLLCAVFSCDHTAQQDMDALQAVLQSNTSGEVVVSTSFEDAPAPAEVMQQPCDPGFDPAPTYTNAAGGNCPNYCQYVYEGWASTLTNAMYVNCIDNPTNWSLSVRQAGEQQYFQFAVIHPVIDYNDFPHGVGLCTRDLIFEPADPDADFACLEYMEFMQTGEGDQNGNKAILNLWMSDEYWDCYEPQTFNFRITARMNLPVGNS